MSQPRTAEDATPGPDEPQTSPALAAIERATSFRVTYVAVLAFLLLYLFTIEVAEESLRMHFEQVAAVAIAVPVSLRPPAQSIRISLAKSIKKSELVRFWKVKVNVVVLARDNETWLHVNGRARIPHYPDRSAATMAAAYARLLPATATVKVSVAHNTMLSNSILIAYATILFIGLFVYNKHVVHLENEVLDEALELREHAANNALRIEEEIADVRAQLREVEPVNREHREEVSRLQSEQASLQAKLAGLASRERELRGRAERATVLEGEGHALEQLLDETIEDLDSKNTEIRRLEKSLKREQRSGGATGGRAKEGELLAKRMQVLYPSLEVDARAIDDIVALQDETTKLRAEECLKRLCEDADNIGFRRKVGGLPNHLSIYELGFAGKRRVYYTKIHGGRFRVLVVGAKNTQQSDLEYIARIPKGEITS